MFDETFEAKELLDKMKHTTKCLFETLPEFKKDPRLILPILEKLKNDSSIGDDLIFSFEIDVAKKSKRRRNIIPAPTRSPSL